MNERVLEKGDGYMVTAPESTPVAEVRVGEPPEAPLSWSWPGKINIANERGYFTGCKAVTFATGEDMNEFFAGTKALLVVDILEVKGTIVAWYTKQLEKDEEEEFEHFQREMGWHMAEWRKKRMEQLRKDREAADAAAKEEQRLVNVGRHCEKDHGALIKELRDKVAKRAIKDVK